MHEFSIASALVDLVAQHTPAGTKLRRVIVEAGPLQGVDPDAMSWAWQSITSGGPFEGAEIEIQLLKWRLHCVTCGQDYSADEMLAPCACGADQSHPIGGDELRLRSLVVEDGQDSPQTDTNEHEGMKPQMNTDEHR